MTVLLPVSWTTHPNSFFYCAVIFLLGCFQVDMMKPFVFQISLLLVVMSCNKVYVDVQ